MGESISEGPNREYSLFLPTFELGPLEDTLPEADESIHTRGNRVTGTARPVLSHVAVLRDDSIGIYCSGNDLEKDGDLEVADGVEEPSHLEEALVNPLEAGDTPSPGPIRQNQVGRVTRHPACSQKIRTWSLEIRELILVLGDSNLSRIPQFNYPSVQIDSFPGAQIHHIKGVLEKLNTSSTTQKVVLSVGLNNCLRNNLFETIKKQLQQLLALARRVFPNASIWIPLIQFSDQLPSHAQQLIKQTNGFLLEHYKTLKMIDKHLFSVQSKDPVHWTGRTASNIFDSWMKQLN